MSQQSNNCAIAVIGIDIGKNVPRRGTRSSWCDRASAEMVPFARCNRLSLSDPCGKQAATSRSAFANSKCSSCIHGSRFGLPIKWPEASPHGLLSRAGAVPSHSCHLKLCLCGKLFQNLILLRSS